MHFLISYLENFKPVNYYFSRISSSRNIKLQKSYKFTLNTWFWSFQPDLAHFEEQFSFNLYKILSWNFQDYHTYILQHLGKFLSYSEMGHVQEKLQYQSKWINVFSFFHENVFLTYFSSMFHFIPPENVRKPKFSVGIEMEH